MGKDLIAKASVDVEASQTEVWEALVDPEAIEEYMFGTHVVTRWEEGSQIIWMGEWEGQTYEDRGKILKIKPSKLLQYSHFSPLSGKEDRPENYHTVTITLVEDGGRTIVTLTQNNNESEEARQHSEDNWNVMLDGFKKYVEG